MPDALFCLHSRDNASSDKLEGCHEDVLDQGYYIIRSRSTSRVTHDTTTDLAVKGILETFHELQQ